MATQPRVRLDALLVEQGWAESRERAKRLIMAGSVWCEGRRLDKPGVQVPADSPLEVREDPCPFVSRGGLKLVGALDALHVDPCGLVCADIGASTGGFTDCLLQRGAARVHGVDVGKHQLHARLREDPRVINHEQVNARHLTSDSLPEPIELVTIDVAFISLGLILPAVAKILAPDARALALVKPQFEAGPSQVRRGVVRDPAVHRDILTRIQTTAEDLGWRWRGACPSPLRGPAGNQEYFILWAVGASAGADEPPSSWITDVVAEAMGT
ncbi:TlyA family RNA methyltransferase [Candidatus Sumerlaeota bacterium]|nr:TlyA family RNA methyltransferase [Candidatus Sumerlaeota bacterium]